MDLFNRVRIDCGKFKFTELCEIEILRDDYLYSIIWFGLVFCGNDGGIRQFNFSSAVSFWGYLGRGNED